MHNFLKGGIAAAFTLLSIGQMSADSGLLLRGIVSSASTPEIPCEGIYYLPTTDGEAFEPIYTESYIFSDALSGYEYDGQYYLHTNSRGYSSIYAINLTAGEYQPLRTRGGYSPMDISEDTQDNTVYGLLVMDGDVPYLDDRVFKLGTISYSESNVSTNISAYLSGKYNALAAAGGTIYAIKTIESGGVATGAQLCTIDKSSGTDTKLYDLNVAPSAQGSATIHPGTGEIYWMVNDDSGQSAKLYKIDPATGNIQLVHTYYDCYEILAIEFVKPAARDIPGAVTDLSATFTNGSTEGTVSFKAPAARLDGTVGETLTYTISDTDSGIELKSGSCSYGESVEATITVPEERMYTISVAVAEGEKAGEAKTTRLYIGKDTPISPVIIKTQYNDDKTVEIEWRKADVGINGGYLEPEEVTYTLVRYPDAQTVLNDKDKTSATDVLPNNENFTIYYYGLTAEYAGKKSTERISDKHFSGTIVPPYEHSFKTADDILGYTTFTGNNSFYHWEFDSWSGSMSVGGDNNVEMDQWLFTPAVKFEAHKNYLVEIHGHTNGSREEKYEIHFGTEPTKEGMTNLAGSATLTSYSASSPDVASFWITPESDGIYHIAIRGVSAAGSGRLYIDKINIQDRIHNDAPGDFTDIEVIREIHGNFSATINFNAPDKTFTGNNLDKISKVTVTRDGLVIKEFTDVTPGARLSCDDNKLEAAGDYIYSFQATNEWGHGKVTKSEPAFIGMLKPSYSEWVVAEELSDGEIKLTWAPITQDVNGVEIDPSRVRYHISSPTSDKSYYFDNFEGTSVTFKAIEDGDSQRFMYFRVVGITDSGWSPTVTYSQTLPVGKPLTSFAESFPGGVFSTYPLASMTTYYVKGDASWETDRDADDIYSQDNDNGYAIMLAYEDGASAGFCTLKMILPQVNPVLSFWVFGFDDGERENNNIVAVDVLDREEISDKPENERWTEVFSNQVSKIAPNGGWAECIADLSAYAGKNVQLRVRGVGNNYMATVIDNLCVKEGEVTSVISPDVAGASVTTDGSSIIISGASGLSTVICTVDGRTVYSESIENDRQSVSVAPGIYVVRIGEKSFKVMVR